MSQPKSKICPPPSCMIITNNVEEQKTNDVVGQPIQTQPNSTGTNTDNDTDNGGGSGSQNSRPTTAWIERFCSEETNRFFCKVDADFILDEFNLLGLDAMVPHFSQAVEIILDKVECLGQADSCTTNSSTDDNCSSHSLTEDGREIELLSSAERLYGLIHARYILTDAGLQRMLAKYKKNRFGQCTRYYCERAPVLPVGLSDHPDEDSVRLYCPRCMDIYVPHFSSKCLTLDGAYFGTGFPHMFFMAFPDCRPSPPTKMFVPTLYGFRIHANAYEHQYRQAEAAERASKPVFLTSSLTSSFAAATAATTKALAVVGDLQNISSRFHQSPNGQQQPPQT